MKTAFILHQNAQNKCQEAVTIRKRQREMKEHNCGEKGQSHEIGKKYCFLKKGHRYCTRRQIGKVQYALASKKAQMLNGKAILR